MENTTILEEYFRIHTNITANITDSCDSYEEYFNSLYKSTVSLTEEDRETLLNMYRIFVPILLFLCVLGLFFNGVLVAVGSLKRSGLRSRSPILILSLNLAATDSLASLFFAIGLFCNSYLPVVHGIKITIYWPTLSCILAVVEILRLSSLSASALHLLSLALVHYKGIVNPLHYRSVIFCSQHRTRSIYLMSFLCWFIPFTILCIYFSSFACDGFRSPMCSMNFILSFKFRVIVLCEFIIPLMFMFFLYIKIFLIIKRHQEQRLSRQQSTTGVKITRSRLTSTGSLLDSSIKRRTVPPSAGSEAMNYRIVQTMPLICAPVHRSQSDRTNASEMQQTNDSNNNTNSSNNTANNTNGKTSTGSGKRVQRHRSLHRISGAIGNILPRPAKGHTESAQTSTTTTTANGSDTGSVNGIEKTPCQLDAADDISAPAASGHAKALVTTLLILGTYTICWMPAVAFFGLTCADYCPFPIQHIPNRNRFYLAFFSNGLIIFKTLIDPFIYTYRMKEMKAALNRYVRLPFTSSPPRQHPPPRQVMHPPRGFVRSQTERQARHNVNSHRQRNCNNNNNNINNNNNNIGPFPAEKTALGRGVLPTFGACSVVECTNLASANSASCQVSSRNRSTVIAFNTKHNTTVAKANSDSASCCDL